MKISENRLRTIIRGLVKESILGSKNRKLNEMYEDYEQGEFEEMSEDDYMPSDDYMSEDDYMPEDDYMSDDYITDDYMPEEEYVEDELNDSFEDMPGEYITDPNFTY